MERMRINVERQEHYGKWVWVNPDTESQRREKCLCLNCENMNTAEKPENCVLAHRLYKVCVDGDIALMVTRCLSYKMINTSQ